MRYLMVFRNWFEKNKNELIEASNKKGTVDFLFKKTSLLATTAGPLLCYLMFILNTINLIGFLRVIVPFYLDLHIFLGIFVLVTVGFSFISLLVHFILAVIVKAGSIETVSSRLYKDTTLEYIQGESSFCSYCNSDKPSRAYHCHSCGTCIVKMDHHCPWINNCIGVDNHKHFMVYLSHQFISAFLMLFLILPLLSKSNSTILFLLLQNFLFSLNSVVLGGWNWYLVFKGQTTYELFKSIDNVSFDFSQSDWKDNFYVVFGTRRVWEALLGFRFGRLPVSGREWSLNYFSIVFDLFCF